MPGGHEIRVALGVESLLIFPFFDVALILSVEAVFGLFFILVEFR